MKTITAIVILICFSSGIFAQNGSPIPKIDQQLANYFSANQQTKVFATTDKQRYKPNESIWFTARAIDQKTNQPIAGQNELIVKLFDRYGKTISAQLFQANSGTASGNIDIPEDLASGHYFLASYLSGQKLPEDVFITDLWIGHTPGNQLTVSTSLKDRISTPGQKNELSIRLNYLSGEIAKNTQLRYQLMNGTEVLEKEKLKTNENGTALLQFTLPEKSNGEPFVCELTDAKNEWKREIYLPSVLNPVEVKFYPEGGTLIQEIPTKVGFTAFNKWGMPVDIEGSVVDQDGKKVALVKTITRGLGVFPLQPLANQKYKFVISDGFGQKQTFELPAVQPSGLAFSVVKTEPGFVTVNLTGSGNQKQNVAMTATSNGKIYWAADMEINGNKRIKLPTRDLPHGINHLSVFSSDEKLLADRLVFVEKDQKINVQIKPEKSSLGQGENMKISVALIDENGMPVSGNVSISVADSFRKSRKTIDIESYFQSETSLENSFSSFSEGISGNAMSPAMIDIFLVANKFKNFDWQTILAFNSDASEGNNSANGISGYVTGKNGAVVNKAKVSLVNNKTMRVRTTTTDANGRFSFPDMKMNQKDDFSAKATDAEGKRELTIVFSKDFEGQLSDLIAARARKLSLTGHTLVADETYFRNNEDLFQKAPKTTAPKNSASDSQRRMLENSTSLMDVIKSIRPYRLMNNQIVFYGSENSINFQGGALIILDGQQMGTDASVITTLSPSEVERINVSTNPMDIQRYTGLNSVGIIEIFRKNAGQSAISATKSQAEVVSEKGPRIFRAEPANTRRDLRTTLQWIPELIIDETGKAEFNVTASKVVSEFIVEIQGISTDGRTIYGNERFTVVK